MQLAGRRIKIFRTTATGLKRRCGSHRGILLSYDATFFRATSSLQHQHAPICNNYMRHCSQMFGDRSVTLTSNCRRGSAFTLFPDHYRSYVAQKSYHPSSQKKQSSFQYLSTANEKQIQHRRRKPTTPSAITHIRQNHTNQTLHAISKRLSFFFSDANLRHDTYARSILEKHQNLYLPLDVILTFKSIRKWTDDPNVVLSAVEYMNDNNNNDKNFIKVTTRTTNSGKVWIGRTEPFDYNTSMKQAQHKIMLLEGWPADQDTRRIEDRIWALLCTNSKHHEEKNLIAYWNTDIGKGVKTIEFQTDEGAADAWNNLRKAAAASRENPSNSQNPNRLDIKMKEDVDEYREYQLKIQNLSLVARSMINTVPDIDLSKEEKERILSLFEHKTNQPKPLGHTQNELKQAASPIEPTRTITKWWVSGNATPPLHKCVEAMDEIFQKHKNLPPPSREWLHEYIRLKNKKRRRGDTSEIDHQQRHEECVEVFNDAANLILCIKQSISEGNIRGFGGKDAYLLSELLGRAMLIFSETPPPRGTHSRGRKQQLPSTNGDKTATVSSYEACLGVIGMLRSLNLDVLSSHYACTIRAACHEARWEEASNVFLNQINGNDGSDASDDMITGGFSPINPTLGWDQPLEIGLYAVARDAWYKSITSEEQHASPGKQVFDAAMKMCMISPSGQGSYVLAAGSALGRAGLWSECLDLATEPTSISTYGPSITAAAMLSCIESGRFTEAIDAFDYFMSGNQSVASEWQWSGGNITAIEPICRDLALTAMGNVSSGGYSQTARRMFDVIIDEGSPLSCDGLLGIMHSLENDGNWKEAAQLLDRFVSSNFNAKGTKWRIVPNLLQLQKEDSDDGLASDAEVYDLLEKLLASTMRVCNKEGHFGLAAVLCAIANKLRDDSSGYVDLTTSHDEDAILGNLTSNSVLQRDPVFEAYTQSLYGLGCKRVADRLINERECDDNDTIVYIPKRMMRNLPKAESWIAAAKSIDRLLMARNTIQIEPGELCSDSSFLFERGLSKAMEYCNDSNQPAAALYLFQYAARILLTKKNQHLADRFKSFLGMGNQANQHPREEIFTSDDALDFSGIQLTDSILAAIINAFIKMGRPEQALSTFNNAIGQQGTPLLMRQSVNSIIDVLLLMDVDECVSSLDDKISTPATFITIAKYLADNGVWHGIGELYNQARRVGCVSEELGFIAMQSVNESELKEGKIIVFRKIAEDVANTIGIDKDEWITSRYWEIKRYVGYHYARVSSSLSPVVYQSCCVGVTRFANHIACLPPPSCS